MLVLFFHWAPAKTVGSKQPLRSSEPGVLNSHLGIRVTVSGMCRSPEICCNQTLAT